MCSDRWNHFIFVLFYIFHIPQFKGMTHLLFIDYMGMKPSILCNKFKLIIKLCDMEYIVNCMKNKAWKVRKLDLFSDHSVGTFSELLLKEQFSINIYDQHIQTMEWWHYSVPNSWLVFKISILTMYSRTSKLFSGQSFNCLSDHLRWPNVFSDNLNQLWNLSGGWLFYFMPD